MQTWQRMLEQNKAWAAERVREDAGFFERLAHIQAPEVLWIGCSDSRVAANVITGTQPGEIFVQRNVANLVVHTDVNLLSVLEYAVNVLQVKDVVVCGHYGCGGVRAAMTNGSLGIIDTWLGHIRDIFRLHEKELMAIANEDARANRLAELNVEEQVLNLAKTTVVQRSWKHRRAPRLHGWIYGLTDGILKPLREMEPGAPLDRVYRFDNL